MHPKKACHYDTVHTFLPYTSITTEVSKATHLWNELVWLTHVLHRTAVRTVNISLSNTFHSEASSPSEAHNSAV